MLPGSGVQGSGRCHFHPERIGLGVCVECRRVICQECTTQFEGINRCAACLDARLRKLHGPGERREWGVGSVTVALLALGLLYGLGLLVARLAQAAV